jgi:uncharacterized DUF497 family protein
MEVDFEPAKNEKNIRERGLSFERAGDLDFASAVVHEDIRKAYPEPRFVALGFLDGRLHVLCFTPIAGGIRVISFRKGNRREEKVYEQAPTHD